MNNARRGFFEALSMSEDDGEDSGSGFSEEDESGDESIASEQAAQPVRKSRFEFNSDSESSEEESSQRYIKSQKEKMHDEMNALVDAIEDAADGEQWRVANDSYDRLLKLMGKSHQGSHGVPRAVYLMMAAMEKTVADYAGSPKLKSLNAEVAKSFNALRQKLRKALAQFGDQIKRAEAAEDEDDESVADSASVTGSGKTAMVVESKVAELTSETILKRLQEIISSRGKKNVDKQENIATLRKMITLSKSRRHTIHVYIALAAHGLESSSGSLGYMPVEHWSALLSDLSQLIGLMQEEEEEEKHEHLIDLKPDEEELGLATMTGIRGTIISYTQRADDEFTRALQSIDPHSGEYLEFLKDEPRMYGLLARCRLALVKGADQSEIASQLTVRQLEHIYHRKHEIVVKYFDGNATVLDHCRFLYAHGGEKVQVRALLYHVYWLSIHDQYTMARDLMLASRVQEALSSLDISTQILYNRALVQVGFAAFRSGHLKETYFALQELCSTGRPKELLAQGLVGQKYTEKGDMDRAERQRLVPFHMQINIEKIDCIFLTVSMLLEIPQQAVSSRRYFQGERRLYQSRHLRRILDAHDRNLFNGPPENTRELIVAASKALANGDWRECEKCIMSISLWDTLTNPTALRALLRHKIRESALYAFIYSVGNCYSTLSMEVLARDFDLPLSLVVRIVTKLITDHGVPAQLSPANDQLLWNTESDLTPTQEAILTLKDKVNYLRERNEETADLLNTLHHGHSRNPSTRTHTSQGPTSSPVAGETTAN